MPPGHEDIGPTSSAPTWVVVHGVAHPHAQPLGERLNGLLQPRGLQVRAVPLWTLLTSVKWHLQFGSGAARCALSTAAWSLTGRPEPYDRRAAGSAPKCDARLAGIVHCGLQVVLPQGVQDALYKSAEWNALLVAWLHGAPCPVINRPRCDGSLAVPAPSAVWRQRAARFGLPIWPIEMGDGAVPDPREHPCGMPGLLVTGNEVSEAIQPQGAAPGWPVDMHAAAKLAAASAGCEWLAWTGARDASGLWRIGGATTTPDLGFFGEPALHALAGLMTRPCPRSESHAATAGGP